ncbi:MAG TPA: hypothetical protein PL033_08545 [Candidatus Brocadiia bacterium]|nr:hypothetical protein [Candidatus Brocadiia bacterium]
MDRTRIVRIVREILFVTVGALSLMGCPSQQTMDPPDQDGVRPPQRWPDKDFKDVMTIAGDYSRSVKSVVFDIEGAWLASPRLSQRVVPEMTGRLYFRSPKQMRLRLERMGKVLFEMKSDGVTCEVLYPGMADAGAITYKASGQPPVNAPMQFFPDDIAEALDISDCFGPVFPMMLTSPDAWRLYFMVPGETSGTMTCRKQIEINRATDLLTAVARFDGKGQQYFACRFFEHRFVGNTGDIPIQMPQLIQLYYPLENTQVVLPITKCSLNTEVSDKMLKIGAFADSGPGISRVVDDEK